MCNNTTTYRSWGEGPWDRVGKGRLNLETPLANDPAFRLGRVSQLSWPHGFVRPVTRKATDWGTWVIRNFPAPLPS